MDPTSRIHVEIVPRRRRDCDGTAANIDHYRRDVTAYILPALGAHPLVEVSPVDIVRLLEQVEADTSGAVAGQLRANLQALFADAVDEWLIVPSPSLRRRKIPKGLQGRLRFGAAIQGIACLGCAELSRSCSDQSGLVQITLIRP
jgi:hypothetical protein